MKQTFFRSLFSVGVLCAAIAAMSPSLVVLAIKVAPARVPVGFVGGGAVVVWLLLRTLRGCHHKLRARQERIDREHQEHTELLERIDREHQELTTQLGRIEKAMTTAPVGRRRLRLPGVSRKGGGV